LAIGKKWAQGVKEATVVRVLLSELPADESAYATVIDNLVLGKPIQIFPMGRTVCADGRKIHIDDDDARALAEYAAKNPNEYPVTYDHERDVRKGSQAAGWWSGLVVAAEGIYSNAVKWTKEAAGELIARAWRYISGDAAGYYDEEGWFHPRRLLGASLVPKPAVLGMDEVTLSEQLSQKYGLAQNGGQKGVQMDLTKIRQKLGLAADAGEDEILTAISKFSGKTCPKCGEPDGDEHQKMCSHKTSVQGGEKFAIGTKTSELPKPLTRQDITEMFSEVLQKERADIKADVEAKFAAQRTRERAEQLVNEGFAAGKILAVEKEEALKDAIADVERFARNLPRLAVRGPVSDAFKPGAAPDPPKLDPATFGQKPEAQVIEGDDAVAQMRIRSARAIRLNEAIKLARANDVPTTAAFAYMSARASQKTGDGAGEGK